MDGIQLLILGTAQDAGYPHAACYKDCCASKWENFEERIFPVSIALANYNTMKWWMIEASPDFKDQLHLFRKITHAKFPILPEGILLTHAHAGHYTGLMQLGREIIGSQNIKTFAMPRLKNFLENNGPWSQLVSLNNIDLELIHHKEKFKIDDGISIEAFLVPHRDEYSETVGFSIHTNNKKVLFIPDINKWEEFEEDINELIKRVDFAFLDGSFFADGELSMDMSLIPHPFVSESMERFQVLSTTDKSKVHFIHFNHTNPLLRETEEKESVLAKGFNIAQQRQLFKL